MSGCVGGWERREREGEKEYDYKFLLPRLVLNPRAQISLLPQSPKLLVCMTEPDFQSIFIGLREGFEKTLNSQLMDTKEVDMRKCMSRPLMTDTASPHKSIFGTH